LFVVDEKFRNQGIGTRLLKVAEKKCTKNFYMLYADTCTLSSSEKKFYIKHGFKK